MRRRSNKNKIIFLIITGAIIALFFTAFLFKSFPPKFFVRAAVYVSRPIIFLREEVMFWLNKAGAALREKEDLITENDSLRQKMLEFQEASKFTESVLKENEELKKILGINLEKDFVVAHVIMRPGYGVYNSLVIDVGSEEGIQHGMLVTAFGNILLGHIIEVQPSFSYVKLISHPGEETNVFIDNKMPAICSGKGSENLEIILPNAAEVKIGDSVSTLGTVSFFVGLVEKIFDRPEDPFQEIAFRLPVNIQELKYVYVMK